MLAQSTGRLERKGAVDLGTPSRLVSSSPLTNACGSRIERILHQFLDRALEVKDDLARVDPVDGGGIDCCLSDV